MTDERKCFVEYTGPNWPVYVPLHDVMLARTFVARAVVLKLRIRAFKFALYESMPAVLRRYLRSPRMEL
jgi:hypothetical protein